ncbi:uncharacterized protein LACBIDRAFT_316422 [Laccaria bicolor S238N-H82]|uniref:Predicted protein n=1 Tax=Laccaria bicolor (strain S238N-H82 / ATCC MYA-4686) TaxID=486041 RepID=B0E0X5_LACBS|nr:uncharacterized protein LACBIDRAFT_316422 [Laccaria bicolor S238N-H82]EDQ99520.1 predicted protein [Laccaria bicolor S238N-H82]|eukprot:XP_001889869.1 predicted protein [Laccaria bicolor S238N-H82]
MFYKLTRRRCTRRDTFHLHYLSLVQLLMLGFRPANDLPFDSGNRVPRCGGSSIYEESAKVEERCDDRCFLGSRRGFPYPFPW